MTRPPNLNDLPCGYQLAAGVGKSTVLASIDFETYSEAGFFWDEKKKTYCPLPGLSTKGLQGVGIAAYATHTSTKVLCLAYDLKDGLGERTWLPWLDRPKDLFNYLANGGLIQAWNAAFEFWIWNSVCTKKYGWPELPAQQLRCAMAKARAFALPGGLEKAAAALHTEHQKNKDGRRLIKKFCAPQLQRVWQFDDGINRRGLQLDMTTDNAFIGGLLDELFDPENDHNDFLNLVAYCEQDVSTEAEVSSRIPDLSDFELRVWQLDQIINRRGVQIDMPTVDAFIAVLNKLYFKYLRELFCLTDGEVGSVSEVKRLVTWLRAQDIDIDDVTVDSVDALLETEPPDKVQRVLKIRRMLGLSSVKKIFAMKHRSVDGRLYDLFVYHKAKTGRAAGDGVQPQNLPRNKRVFDEDELEKVFLEFSTAPLHYLENKWGEDIIAFMSSSLRAIFCAKPGYTLIGSDFSAIEAVVLAELAGESWRQEVFRTDGKIYEITASNITGVSLAEILEHKEKTGEHHPLRELGKVAELASGYQGGHAAWLRFGAGEFLSKGQIDRAVKVWREASPKITTLWYSLEKSAKLAIRNPGQVYAYRLITYAVHHDVLYCTLPSGRSLIYHNPRIINVDGWEKIVFDGYNSNARKGRVGWVPLSTYGGMLTENVVQAVARDILMHSALLLEEKCYSVVLHVHDEIVSEVPEDFGSLCEFENVMSTMPNWAEGWPVRAKGGWVCKRYKK